MDYYDKLNTEQNQVLSGLMQAILKNRIKNNAASGASGRITTSHPPKARKSSMLNHVSEHVFHFL